MKRKILFIYPAMIIGGSTTSLLSLLNSLDAEKYEVDLQLFRNRGPLLDAIPEHVNLLPEAQLHKGALGKLCKLCLFAAVVLQLLQNQLHFLILHGNAPL